MTTLRVSAKVEAEAVDGTVAVRIKGGKALHPDTHIVLAREVIAMHTGLPADHWRPINISTTPGDAGDIQMDLRAGVPDEPSGRRALRV